MLFCRRGAPSPGGRVSARDVRVHSPMNFPPCQAAVTRCVAEANSWESEPFRPSRTPGRRARSPTPPELAVEGQRTSCGRRASSVWGVWGQAGCLATRVRAEVSSGAPRAGGLCPPQTPRSRLRLENPLRGLLPLRTPTRAFGPGRTPCHLPTTPNPSVSQATVIRPQEWHFAAQIFSAGGGLPPPAAGCPRGTSGFTLP